MVEHQLVFINSVMLILSNVHVFMTRVLCFLDIDTVTHLRHAVMDISADESYQLPTKENDICLRAAKNVAGSLLTPTEETMVFCD